MTPVASPLHGVRVLNLGGIWAGRVAALLMADQGAEVIEVNDPQRLATAADALLLRGKRIVDLDLKSASGQAEAVRLASTADIVLDNLGRGRAERFGLGYAKLAKRHPALVYVSMPGFGRGDPLEATPAWEGAIAALMGVYTDIPALGRLLGGSPVYTAIPMASAYGGVHAAISACMAYLHRLDRGIGQFVEVPLADAVMSAMALHAMDVENQPARYDWPAIDKVMTRVAFPILRELHESLAPDHQAAIAAYLSDFGRPQAANYRCADGRLIFINASEHSFHSRVCLEVLGVLDELLAQGMILGSPYAEGGSGNNLADPASLTPHWRRRLSELLRARFATRPAQEWEVALRRAGVPATVVQTAQEWLQQAALQKAGIVTRLPAPSGPSRLQPGRFVTIEGAAIQSPALGASLPTKENSAWLSTAPPHPPSTPARGPGILAGLRVLDLSNIIAAPTAGRVLAEFGADVVKIDAPTPRAGPRLTVWFGLDVNQGKRSLILDLKHAQGRAAFEHLVQSADVVLHNFLDTSAAALGITHAQLVAIKPDIITCQLTAWGGPDEGPYQNDPAFDPVLQAASGITTRYGSVEEPVHHGSPSCIDYLTGYCAAMGIAQALVAKRLGRGGSLVRTSLAMSAQLIQFPFMVEDRPGASKPEPSGQQATGSGPHHRLYRAQDGWAFLAAREQCLPRIADALELLQISEASLSAVFARSTIRDLKARLADIPAVAIVPVRRLDALRAACVIDGDEKTPVPRSGGPAMLRAHHPSGGRVALPLPTWYRLSATPVRRLAPASLPGSDGRAVLREMGFAEAELDRLQAGGALRTSWPLLPRYLPR